MTIATSMHDDQAAGLRRMFAGAAPCFVPVVSNPHVGCGGVLLERLSTALVERGARVLVVNAASQGETIDDVLVAYRASTCAGMVLSKIDEAIKLGPALDAAIRHRLTVVGVANGQRVPEDWHRLSANALVQRALRGTGSAAWRLEGSDVSLVFAASAAVGAVAAH